MSKETKISNMSKELVIKLVSHDGLDIDMSMHRKIESRVASLLESYKKEIKSDALLSMEYLSIQNRNCLVSLVDLDDVKSELNKL
jgi:hypothetical protein